MCAASSPELDSATTETQEPYLCKHSCFVGSVLLGWELQAQSALCNYHIYLLAWIPGTNTAFFKTKRIGNHRLETTKACKIVLGRADIVQTFTRDRNRASGFDSVRYMRPQPRIRITAHFHDVLQLWPKGQSAWSWGLSSTDEGVEKCNDSMRKWGCAF